jgi:hypothetical protein
MTESKTTAFALFCTIYERELRWLLSDNIQKWVDE